MKLKIIWPGKTKSEDWRSLQEFYLGRIRLFGPCSLIETKEAKGLSDKQADKIKEIEARYLEKQFEDDYIICLFDKGKEMSSEELARFLGRQASSAHRVTFVVGGFAGLAQRILKRADFVLSLSRLTFSHELCRVVLLEQVYRALTILKGMHYAK